MVILTPRPLQAATTEGIMQAKGAVPDAMLPSKKSRARAAAVTLLFVGLAVLSLLSSSPSSSSSPSTTDPPSSQFRSTPAAAALLGASKNISGTLRLTLNGGNGFNNQRQVFMVGAWAARELGLDLLLPSHFEAANFHDSPTLPFESVYELDGIREYVGGEVGLYDIHNVAEAEVSDDGVEVITVRIQVNSNCLGNLTGDFLRAAVDSAIAKSGGDGKSERGGRPIRYNIELTGLRWEFIDSAFPDSEDGRRAAHELITAFKFVDDISICADKAANEVLATRCPGGVHAVHLRVGDRRPIPLFDCARGEDVLGRKLVESTKINRQCQDIATKKNLNFEEILAADLPPTEDGKRGELGPDQCVYVATNGPDSDDMNELRAWAKTGGRGVQVLTYDDVVLRSDAMSECRSGGGRAIQDPSLFEQALMARVTGRFVSSFPSSWDSYVLHDRLHREETTEETMFMAREDLALYHRKVNQLVTKTNSILKQDWCLKALPPTSVSRG